MALSFVPDAPPKKLSFVPDTGHDLPPPEPTATDGPIGFINGLVELGLGGLLNIPHNAEHGMSDLISMATGGPEQKGVIPGMQLSENARNAAESLQRYQPITVQDLIKNYIKEHAPTVARAGGDVADVAQAVAPFAGAKGGLTMDEASAAEGAGGVPPITDTNEALKAAGFKRLPRQGGDSLPSRAAASMVGEGSVAPAQSIANQGAVDTFAAHEAKVPQGTEINYTTLEEARKNGPAKVYDATHNSLPVDLRQDPKLEADIKGVSDTTSQLPRSPDVEELKNHMLSQPDMTRDQLFANIEGARERAARFYASEAPEAEAMGDAYSQLANAYEDFVGRQLKENTGAVTQAQWEQARTDFAKNYTVQAALQGNHVRASKIGQLQQKDPGRLTGGLQLIAEQYNRYPLSTSFGPTTLAEGGIGSSGSLGGSVSRHLTGPIIGGSIGSFFGPHGISIGTAAGTLGSQVMQEVLRRALGGSPEAAARAAQTAIRDPRLGSFFDQEVAPYQEHPPLPPFPGNEPPSLADDLGAGNPPPSPTKGPKVSPNVAPLEEGSLHTDLTASTPEHPGAGTDLPYTVHPDSVGLGPLRSGRKIGEAPPRTMIGADGEPVETGLGHPELTDRLFQELSGTGDNSDLAAVQSALLPDKPVGAPRTLPKEAPRPGAGTVDLPVAPGLESDEISLGGEHPRSLVEDLSDHPDVRSQPLPEKTIGKERTLPKEEPTPGSGTVDLPERPGLSDDELELGEYPSLKSLMDDLTDYARVHAEGVPEGTMSRTSPIVERGGSDTASVKAASPEAMNRGTRNIIDVNPDGTHEPVLKDVTQIDAKAPKGHILMDADTGEIIDRGGLPKGHAEGLRNRWKAMQNPEPFSHPPLGDDFD